MTLKNFDDSVKINHNWSWPYIPDHPCRILIIVGSEYGKTIALRNLIIQQPDIEKIYLYVKDPLVSKYQLLINKRVKARIEHLENSKVFIDYSQAIDNENLKDYDSTKKRKVLILFDDMIDV